MTDGQAGREMGYDAWNRLVTVKDSTGTTLAAYSYDALGRRVTETHGTAQTTLYYSANWQVLEEGGSGEQTQYVWSAVGTDTLVLRDQGYVIVGPYDRRFYVEQDANNNVTALLALSGGVGGRVIYHPLCAGAVSAADWAARR